MRSEAVTIKARRVLQSGTILPDGTLVKWFSIEREDTFQTLSNEVEVFEGWVEKIHFRDGQGWNNDAAQVSCCLIVSCRYEENDGYIPLLKGARVFCNFNDVANGSTNTKNMGLAVGSVRVRNPKIGSVTFTNLRGLSSELDPVRDANGAAFPTFAQIKAAGEYMGYKVVKFVAKGEGAEGKRKAA